MGQAFSACRWKLPTFEGPYVGNAPSHVAAVSRRPPFNYHPTRFARERSTTRTTPRACRRHAAVNFPRRFGTPARDLGSQRPGTFRRYLAHSEIAHRT